MSYDPLNPPWADGPDGHSPISGDRLDHMDQGISDASTRLDHLAAVANSGSYSDLVGSPNIVQTKADIGLGNVDNTSDAGKPISTATQTALNNKVAATLVGAPSGIASLDGSGKVPTAQLPTGATVANATTTTLGIVQLAGDLAGTATAPTVPGLTSKVTGVTAADATIVITGTTAPAVKVGAVPQSQVTGLATALTNKADASALAAKADASALTSGLATKPNTSALAAVAFSGSYNDLTNKPSGGGSASGTPMVGIGRVNYDNSSTTDLTGYSVFVGQSGAAGNNITGLVARGGVAMRYAGYVYAPSDSTGLTQLMLPSSVQTAWKLTDSGGTLVTRSGGTQTLLDIGLTAVQNAAISYLTTVCHNEGWNAVFLDEINYTYSDGGWSARPSKYASDAAWQAAELSYVTALNTGLGAAGIKVYANMAHSTTAQGTWPQNIVANTTGGFQEDWINWGNMTGSQYDAYWTQYLTWMQYQEAISGFQPQYIMYNATTDTTRFGLAMALMFGTGRGVLYANSEAVPDGPAVTIPEMAQLSQLGQATGAATLSGTTYTRQFTGGTVTLTRPVQSSSAAGLASITIFAGGGSTPTAANDQGFICWAYDPVSAASSVGLTAGVLSLVRVRVPAAATVNNIHTFFATAGSGLTSGQCFAALYSSTGTRLGVTADQATAWASTGSQKMALTTPVAVTAGTYYVALLANGTTPPVVARGASTLIDNINLTSPNFRFATLGTGQTATPSTATISSAAATANCWWVAIS